MIKSQDLRIGNFVCNKHNNVVIKIKSIDLDYFGSSETDGEMWEGRYNILSGIPLTEELLFKCGFEKDGDKEWYIAYDINPETETFGLCFKLEKGILYLDDFYARNNDNPIRHLHQLQNLIFILTGQELEVNL